MQNKSYSTKSIVEAGLISALIVVISLANAYIPAISIIGTFILPIPVTVLYIRHGYKVTIISTIVSAILVGMLYNPFAGLTSAIMFGLTGITLGYCIKRDKEVIITLVLLTAASIIQMIANFFIISTFVNKKGLYDTIAEYTNIIKESFEGAAKLYNKMGVSTEQLAPMKNAIESISPDMIMLIVPAIIIVSSVLSAYFNYVISGAVLRKLKYNVRNIKPFTEWYVNNRIGTFVVIAVLVGILLNRGKISAGAYILNSAMLIMQCAFMLDGAALITYYLRNKFNLPKGVCALIIILTMFNQVGVLIYVYAGVGDLIFDFRKLDPYRKIRND